MKEVLLEGGQQSALVDDDDLEKVVAQGIWLTDARNVVSLKSSRPTVQLHRFVMGCKNGDGKVVEPINGKRLDCRKENLRVVAKSSRRFNRLVLKGSR